jgi:hypothetical protein
LVAYARARRALKDKGAARESNGVEVDLRQRELTVYDKAQGS